MTEQQDYHFWTGSYCRGDFLSNRYPEKVAAVSDIITIMEDMHKQPPDKSWMLYLLEFFLDNAKKIPVELDLICAFDDDGTYNAVFGGHNQHEFSVLPKVGHSYVREIVCDITDHSINYNIVDLNSGETESFKLNDSNMRDKESVFSEYNVQKLSDIVFEGSNQFTGVEWHNRIKDEPFPLRYNTMNSLLQYGNYQMNGSKYVTYQPYRSLIADKDESNTLYPIAFENTMVIKGCICYNLKPGSSNNGLEFHF